MTAYIYNEITSALAADLSASQYDEVEINSSGGDVFAALAIVDTLRQRDVTIRVKGLCASAATLLLCCGKKVIAAENSLFMIHEPSVLLMNRYDAAALEKMQTTLEKITNQVKAVYATRLKKVDLTERWLTAQEALEIGLIDEIDGRVDVTSAQGMLFVNKCAFRMDKSWAGWRQVEQPVKDLAAEVLGLIRDQLKSGADGVKGAGEMDAKARYSQMVIDKANGVLI